MSKTAFNPDDWEGLLLHAANDIDYRALPEEVVAKLALSDDPSISTLALADLVSRQSGKARYVAWTLLHSPGSDRHLKAAALEALYEVDPEEAFRYIEANAERTDSYLVKSMLDLMVVNEVDASREPARSAAARLRERLGRRPEEDGIPAQRRADFLEAYGGQDH